MLPARCSEGGSVPPARPPGPGWRAALAGGLLIALLAVGWQLTVPGTFSIDEVTLLLSARSFAQGYGVEVWNGFEELPSPALVPGWLKVVDGRLVSQYPDFFLLVALPAFRTFGLRGLMLINLLAFAAVCGLTFDLARRRAGERVAAGAVALLALASYAFEYALGAWPHVTSTLCVLAPLALLDRALERSGSRRALGLALAAGGIGGFGIGVRLDVAFALAAFGGALLLQRPARWREAVALAAGALPGVTALALLNREKFGSLNPFSYGPSYGIAAGIDVHLPWLLPGAAGVLLAWVLTRRAVAPRVAVTIAGSALAVLLTVVLATPRLRQATASSTRGIAELVLDLRLRAADHFEAAPDRRVGDPIRHFGVLKKSLLQSVPWTVLAAVPLVLALRRRRGRGRLLLLVAAPAAFVVPYGIFGWDGGWALNQRYFLPALPVLALLAAEGGAGLGLRLGRAPGRWRGIALALTGGLVAGWAVGLGPPWEERVLLDLPLGLAGLLGLLLLLTSRRSRGRATAKATWALALTSVVLGTVSCLAYDLPRSLARRAESAARGAAVAQRAAGEALVLSEPTEALAAAIGPASRIRLANPAQSGYRDLGPLLDLHLTRDRAVIGRVPEERFAQLVDAGFTRRYDVRPFGEPHLRLFEVRARAVAQFP
jgi:hypothetical protein